MSLLVKVTGAIIQRNDKFLIGRRAPSEKSPGLWEFPGGRIRDGEPLISALEKRVKDECGSEIMVNEKIGVIKHKYSHFSITMHGFNCQEKSKIEPIAKDHRWISSKQIDQFAFPKANHKLFSLIN